MEFLSTAVNLYLSNEYLNFSNVSSILNSSIRRESTCILYKSRIISVNGKKFSDK